MPAGLFQRQLAELAQAGYRTIPLEQVISGSEQGSGELSIVLTFDDGYANVLTHGLEPLAQHQFQALQFLVADRLGQCNDWDLPAGEVQEKLMDRGQVRAWLNAGHWIGSHGLSHLFLTRCPPQQAREEIFASKKKLEDMFGMAVEHFCYPYGDWNAAIRDLVAEAGYRAACTTDFGVNPAGTDRLALKRITARYASRNWRNLKAWLQSRFARGTRL